MFKCFLNSFSYNCLFIGHFEITVELLITIFVKILVYDYTLSGNICSKINTVCFKNVKKMFNKYEITSTIFSRNNY